MLLKSDSGAAVASNHSLKRSDHWPTERKKFLIGNPYCKACHPPGRMTKIGHSILHAVGLPPVQVHHIIPFHFCVLLGRPELELDKRNLITLCERGFNHHLVIGHLNSFGTFNPSVFTFVAKYVGWDGEKIKTDAYYIKAIASRPKAWAEMTEDDKAGLFNLMNQLYPR
jgi:hypothetical protein